MSLDSIGEDFEKRPGITIFKIGLYLIIIVSAFSLIGWGLGWFGEAGRVAKEEFGPRAMLQKYEWFKDAAAQLDKKKADIRVFDTNVKTMESDYAGKSRSEWDRTDKEQMNQWRLEVAGIKASYNGLAAEYNAQMAKFNWRFANKGMLPEGATEVLPREFKPYTAE